MSTITAEEEFLDPNINYRVLLAEVREELETLQQDLQNIQNPQLKGYAKKMYIDLKIKYFKLLRDDLTLQVRYSNQQILENAFGSISKGDDNEVL